MVAPQRVRDENMEADLQAVEASASSCNSDSPVVMNANVLGPVFSLSALTGDNDKTDFCPEKFGSGLISGSEGGGLMQIVDPSRGCGLVQVVTDSLSVGQLNLNGISSNTQVTLNGLNHGNADLQQTTLLTTSDTFSHTGAPLFEVQTETVSDQSELQLTTPMIITATSQDVVVSSTSNPTPKRKGGWPKGKKRKKEKESNAPKAPATAYVLYAMDRRNVIKETNPEVPFIEVTKILGSEWSSMTPEEKQKYYDAAEADKKRYMEELKEYQLSEAYQSFLKRKKVKGLCSEDEPSTADGQYVDSATFLNELEEEGLYCKECNQYFSSLHNRREHMFGKQHLQAITSEFEKELQQEEHVVGGETPELAQDVLTSESDQSYTGPSSNNSPLGINKFIEEFMSKNLEREQEIRELKRRVDVARDENSNLLTKCQQYKELEAKLEQDLGNLKAYQAALIAQIDGLRMVPTLFGVINFYINSKDDES